MHHAISHLDFALNPVCVINSGKGKVGGLEWVGWGGGWMLPCLTVTKY